MLALIPPGTAPVIRGTVRIGYKAPQAGIMPDLARIQPQELAVGIVRTVGGAKLPARLFCRCAKTQLHQPASGVHHRAVQIGRSLLQGNAFVILAICKLAGVACVIGNIVQRHAFQHIAYGISIHAAHADIGLR